MPSRRIILNPDEPRTGDFGIDLYNKVHPKNGQAPDIAYMKSQLRGLYGQDVTIRLNGARRDPETGNERRFRTETQIRLNNYNDVFGPYGFYISAVHAALDNDSDDELVVYSLSIEDY